jgi:hypothetical protein
MAIGNLLYMDAVIQWENQWTPSLVCLIAGGHFKPPTRTTSLHPAIRRLYPNRYFCLDYFHHGCIPKLNVCCFYHQFPTFLAFMLMFCLFPSLVSKIYRQIMTIPQTRNKHKSTLTTALGREVRYLLKSKVERIYIYIKYSYPLVI